MTATVFAYIVLFTLLLAGAAAAIEWGTQGRIATRHLWTAAIVFAILAPPAVLAWHTIAQPSFEPAAAMSRASNAATGIQFNTNNSDVQSGAAWQRVTMWATTSLGQLNNRVTPFAIAAWAILSLMLLSWLGAGILRLRRAGLTWQRTTLDGVDVDVSPATGPAVLGFLSHRIVLPAWATTMSPEHRRLVLAHECEHITARDPELLALGLAALVLMPWNVGLWWCAARLRRAIELDCDARVLSRFPSAKAYGYVLLEVAARGRSSGPLAVSMVGLLQLPSQLEQRLRAMTRPRTIGYRSALCGGLAAVVAVSAAFVAPVPSLQLPDNIGSEPAAAMRMRAIDAARIGRMVDTVPKQPRRADSLTAAERDSLTVLVREKEARAVAVRTARARVESTQVELNKRRFELNVAKGRVSSAGSSSARVESAYVARRAALASKANPNMTYFDYQVEEPAQATPNSPSPIYPASLRSKRIEGEVDIEFVVDKTGSIEPGSEHVTKSTNPLFTSAVLEALPRMRFVPAEIGGVRVKQLVQQPFTFAIRNK